MSRRPGHPRFYDWIQRAVARDGCWELFVKEYLRPVPGERLLDLGCGVGRILDFLPPVRYTGLDSNPSSIRYAQKKGKKDAEFVCADLSRAPWPVSGFFDRVTATGVLHHLPDSEARELLKNARKVMKPGAKLVTFDGCYEPHQPFPARLLLAMDRGKYVRDREGYVSLARNAFDRVDAKIEKRFLRVPYTHLVMEMTAV